MKGTFELPKLLISVLQKKSDQCRWAKILRLVNRFILSNPERALTNTMIRIYLSNRSTTSESARAKEVLSTRKLTGHEMKIIFESSEVVKNHCESPARFEQSNESTAVESMSKAQVAQPSLCCEGVQHLQIIVPVANQPWWITERYPYFSRLSEMSNVSITFAFGEVEVGAISHVRETFDNCEDVNIVVESSGGLATRLRRASESRSSSHTLFHPHDEYFSSTGIARSLQLLKSDRLSASNGRTLALRLNRGILEIGEMYKYPSYLRPSVDQESFKRALEDHFSPYKQAFFNSITPTDFFETCVSTWERWPDDVILGEIIFEVVGSLALSLWRHDTPIRLRNSLGRTDWNRHRWDVHAMQIRSSYSQEPRKPFISWLWANGFSTRSGKADRYIGDIANCVAQFVGCEKTIVTQVIYDGFEAYRHTPDRQKVGWEPLKGSRELGLMNDTLLEGANLFGKFTDPSQLGYLD